MINVYSFQKMSSAEQCPAPKNISKTSHFAFGQNYKKLVANTKGSFDFRKFIQKNNHAKKNIPPREEIKRNPLQEVSSSEGNVQSLSNNKAFKIRCYSRKTKQNQKSEEQVTISKLIRYRPKVNQIRQRKVGSTAKKTNPESRKWIRMHKFDNFQELQIIANPLKIIYNDFLSESDRYAQKALIFDVSYLTNCLKTSLAKTNQKQKQKQHFMRKIVFIIKRIIDEKFTHFPMQRAKSEERPQLIFKVNTEEEISELFNLFEQCEFNSYYCVFSVQKKFIQSLGTYNLTKINHLAQNIVILDSFQNLTQNPPLINSLHFISFSTFGEKTNFNNALQSIFSSLQNLQIRFSAEQFESEDKTLGQIIQLPVRNFIERVKQKKTLKSCKKTSRQNRQRCQSSYENCHHLKNHPRKQQVNLQNFKEKILKYLKIVGNETSLETKKSKQLSNRNNEQFECMTGRQQCSKTNYQIVSELIRLNSHVHKQILSYQRKMQDIPIDINEKQPQKAESLRFQKMYINYIY